MIERLSSAMCQCDNQYGVICKKLRSGYTPPTMPPATTQLPACAQGLVQTDNYCYQSGDSKKSWQEALDDCVLKGGCGHCLEAGAHVTYGVTNWKQGEPNNYDNNEDCVAMNALTSQWNDAACYSFYNWICMAEL
ncbi:hypothetical protein DPMN_114985 [Dreissena polymorpha]|uniref:C-type lectin domain-containing protein n=1 Tax=Dreissena polymorpha TaxID=45954 RepID=A0A9D4KKE5_DREPO|nr:hypothetical protein DPMN_114985 [Dreissena polymorpha]